MYIAVLLLMMRGMDEYSNALKNKNNSVHSTVLYLLAFVLFGSNILTNVFGINSYALFLSFYFMVICTDLIMTGKSITMKRRLLFWLGVTYIIVGFEAMILVRNFVPSGELFTWMIFVITVISDSMAYFVGKLFGKRKLIPSVSPNKTIEGSVGAIVFTILGCLAYGKIINLDMNSLVLIGFLGSIISQCGDLVASKVKRYTGIKDFSNLIPQHGGILDRLDSALLVSQFMFVVILILM